MHYCLKRSSRWMLSLRRFRIQYSCCKIPFQSHWMAHQSDKREILTMLPFQSLLHKMVINQLYFVTLWMYAFLVKNVLSGKFSPQEFISCHRLISNIDCKVPFGTYCEIHDEPDQSNSMQPCNRPVKVKNQVPTKVGNALKKQFVV